MWNHMRPRIQKYPYIFFSFAQVHNHTCAMIVYICMCVCLCDFFDFFLTRVYRCFPDRHCRFRERFRRRHFPKCSFQHDGQQRPRRPIGQRRHGAWEEVQVPHRPHALLRGQDGRGRRRLLWLLFIFYYLLFTSCDCHHCESHQYHIFIYINVCICVWTRWSYFSL